MLPLLGLVLAAPPTLGALPPTPLLQQELVLRLVDPPRCLHARCLAGEWRVEAMPTIPSGQLPVDGNALPGGGARPNLPGTPPEQVKLRGNNARVGLQYGRQMAKTGQTSVRVVMETGYRLQGHADDGISGTGPVLHGQLEWSHALGQRSRLSQTARLEAGQHGAYLRNNLLLDLSLHPKWSLGAGVETRRDSHLTTRNQTDLTLKLRYLL